MLWKTLAYGVPEKEEGRTKRLRGRRRCHIDAMSINPILNIFNM